MMYKPLLLQVVSASPLNLQEVPNLRLYLRSTKLGSMDYHDLQVIRKFEKHW